MKSTVYRSIALMMVVFLLGTNVPYAMAKEFGYLTNDKGQLKSRWYESNIPVEYRIHEDGCNDGLGGAEFTAVQAGAQTWEDDQGSFIDFTYRGTTKKRAVWPDNENGVAWVTDDPLLLPNGTYAYVHPEYDPWNPNRLVECDMRFNDHYQWRIDESSKLDVQKVATHEFGHFLLLDDLYKYQESEYKDIQRMGNANSRSLGWGDIAGVRYLYPHSPQASGWFGGEDQGGGVEAAYINNNYRHDLLVLWVDNPGGENSIYYRIGWDLSLGGIPSSWTTQRQVRGVGVGSETLGAGVAIGSVNDNLLPDLVAVWIDDPTGDNYAYYRIGWDMDQNGIILDDNWTPRSPLGTSPVSDNQFDEARGAGAALTDLNGNGRPELVTFYIDPVWWVGYGWQGNDLLYRIGWDLNTDGNTNTWTDHWVTIINDYTEGAGVAVSDINGNATPDLTIMYTNTNTHVQEYLVGWDVNANGQPSTWSNFETAPNGGVAASTQGSGLASPYLNLFYDDFESTFIDDFNDGDYNGWIVESGTWAVEDGWLSQSDLGTEKAINTNSQFLQSNLTIEVKAKKIEGNEGFSVGMTMSDGSWWIWNIGGWGNTVDTLEYPQGVQIDPKPFSVTTGQPYELKIVLNGNNIKTYRDGYLIHDVTANWVSNRGRLRLRTWATHAHFDNIIVNDGWIFDSGAWTVEGGELSQSDLGSEKAINTQQEFLVSPLTTLTIELRAKKIEGNEGFCVGMTMSDESWWIWNIGGWGNTLDTLEYPAGTQVDPKPFSVATGQSYNLKMVLKGNNVKTYRDGQLIHDVTADWVSKRGYLRLRTWGTHSHFDDVRVSNNMPELLFLWIDNQPGENTAYYRTEWETRIDSHP